MDRYWKCLPQRGRGIPNHTLTSYTLRVFLSLRRLLLSWPKCLPSWPQHNMVNGVYSTVLGGLELTLLWGKPLGTAGIIVIYSRSVSALSIITQYVVCSLAGQPREGVPTPAVCACLFVCRQVCNTVEGLLALKQYSLQTHIASRLLAANGVGVAYSQVGTCLV